MVGQDRYSVLTGNSNGQIGETIAVEIACRECVAEPIIVLGCALDARAVLLPELVIGPAAAVACSPAAEPYSTLTPPA